MSGILNVSKALFSILAASVILVGCGRNDAGQAENDMQSSASESRSATASSNAGADSSGTSGTSSGAYGDSSSAGRAVDDSVITTKAKTALLADTTVKGSDINVETNKGVVSLNGAVEDSRQKERAASIVKGIDGVKSVQNKLTVEKK